MANPTNPSATDEKMEEEKMEEDEIRFGFAKRDELVYLIDISSAWEQTLFHPSNRWIWSTTFSSGRVKLCRL
jgi:hypothetical protein